MGLSSSLYLKNPDVTRFLCGGRAEAEALFGGRLPGLPQPEVESGREVFFVKFPAAVRTLLVRHLQSLLREIGADIPGAARADAAAREQPDFQEAIGRILRSVRATDRRLGLVNLFWLAHTREVAECLGEIEARVPSVRKLKYSLHPLLSSFYRRVDQAVRRSLDQAEPGRLSFMTGARENTSLVDALLDDGFAFTEQSISDFDFNHFLAANKRYRLPADVFFEIYAVLFRETETRLRDGDRGLLARVSRHMPLLPKEQLQTQPGVVKVMMNTHVISYLMGDLWGTSARLMASEKIRAEADRRRSAEVMDSFGEVLTGVKRFEIISHLRDRIVPGRAFGEQELDQRSGSRRLFEFGDAARVTNNAVNATVLFLDLRGFTKTSEGQISERDLAEELYTVFDEFVPHVRRFGGTVDKFLGDGIMVTWGTRRVDPLDTLNALRTAVLCQETLTRLRREGKTYFKMGIAIHYGRVHVARFIADEESVQTTVIGRHVNLAGRLSSAAKAPIDEDDPGPEPAAARGEYQVTVDGEGTLFNEGIALSRETLLQLEENLQLVHSNAAGTRHLEYFDEQIGRRLFIRYAGDAKFKGVRSSFPVYEVDFVH